jgi:hypothetical protein
MPDKPERDIEELMSDDALIDNALVDAVRDAVLQHKRAGNPIAVWESGHVVWVPPEEIAADSPASGGCA